MGAVPIAAIGVITGWKAGAFSSTYADTGFTKIRHLKTHGSLVGEPNSADATTFDNLVTTTSVPLLNDIGGTIEFTANLNDQFISDWNACAEDASIATNGGCWFAILNPGMSKGTVFYGKASIIRGYGEESANNLSEISVSITVLEEPKLIAMDSTDFSSPTTQQL